MNSLLGETIFPVIVEIKEDSFSTKYIDFIKSKLNSNLQLNIINDESDELYTYKYDKWWRKMFKQNNVNINNGTDSFLCDNSIITTNDDGIFEFDLQSMKLKVWSKKASSFAVFGATRIGNEMDNNRDSNCADHGNNTQVYLKGIYIDNINFESDAGLLETLDIHKGMPKKYINLSRGSFTGPGSNEIKNTIYSEVFNAAISGLKKINEYYEANDDSLEEKIINNITQSFTEAKKNNSKSEIENCRQKVLSVIFLVYLHIRYNERNALYKTYNKKPSIWLNVLRKLRGILSDEWFVDVNKHINAELLGLEINIAYIGQGVRGVLDAIRYNPTKSFADLIDPENKISVLCIKSKNGEVWMDIPLTINNYENKKNGNKISEEKPTEEKSTEEIFERIKHFQSNKFTEYCNDAISCGDTFIEDIEQEYSALNVFLKNNTPRNQALLLWLLRNMQISAKFISFDGNCVLNVLTYDDINYYVLNDGAKSRIMKKIAGSEKIYPRYAVVSWSDYYYLGQYEVPNSVYPLYIGPKPYTSKQYLILPYTGNTIRRMFDFVEKWSQKDNWKKIENMCDDLLRVINFIANISLSIQRGRMIDGVEKIIKNSKIHSIQELVKIVNDRNDIFIKQIKSGLYSNNEDSLKITESLGKNNEDNIIKLPTTEELLDGFLGDLISESTEFNENKYSEIVKTILKYAKFIMFDAEELLAERAKNALCNNMEIDPENAFDAKEKFSNNGMVEFYHDRTNISSHDLNEIVVRMKDEIMEIIISSTVLRIIKLTKIKLTNLLGKDMR